MATLAAIFRRPAAAGAAPELAPHWSESGSHRLRPLPGEDIYFFSKKIDNSRVVRESDPAAKRRCVSAVSVSLIAAVLIILLMLPNGLAIAAGYQIHALEREHERLLNERAALELDEARLLSPERIEQLAHELRMVAPSPARVVFLDAKSGGALAMNVRPK